MVRRRYVTNAHVTKITPTKFMRIVKLRADSKRCYFVCEDMQTLMLRLYPMPLGSNTRDVALRINPNWRHLYNTREYGKWVSYYGMA